MASLALIALAASAQQRMEVLHGTRETLYGVLIDGGCEDRSLWNLGRAGESQAGAMPVTQQPTTASKPAQSSGITVQPKTLAAERKDVIPVMNPDVRARQSDPTCALKAGTRAYAVLLDSGRLLDLDDGGNIYASMAVAATPQGQAMINARGPGFKPRVSVKGMLQGDRVFVDKLQLGHIDWP